MTRSDRFRGDAHEERLLELQRLQLQRYWPAEFHVVERNCLTMVLGVIRIHHILTAAGFQYWDAWNLAHPVLKPIAEIFRSPLKRKLAIFDENRRRILTNMVLTQQKVEKAMHAVIELHFQLLHLGRTRHITTCPDMRHNMLQRLLERYRNRADLQLESFRVEKGSRGALRVVMVASGSAHTTEGRGRETSVHSPTAEEGSRENPICLIEDDPAVLRQEHETMRESLNASNPESRYSVFTDAGFVDRDVTDADLLRLYQFDTVQRFVVIPEPEDSDFMADSRSETRSTSGPPMSTARRGTVSGPAASQTRENTRRNVCLSPQYYFSEKIENHQNHKESASFSIQEGTKADGQSTPRTSHASAILTSPLESTHTNTKLYSPIARNVIIAVTGSTCSSHGNTNNRSHLTFGTRSTPSVIETLRTGEYTSSYFENFASPHHADCSTIIIRRGDSANSGANLSGALQPSATTRAKASWRDV
ncbi:hypothetical protein BN1723_006035 [Verticillium longisporum]|uniref:Uncharacterized protein n=1 Tax=Verticillium longisporum TaxID=100787 RepID=A0A0G4LVI2_VERLO|nr:hypothetical protein BN1708_004068 [Verticillium longisporum]CRK44118.1 hypothetical protein BN1723_006035 [Verticillium longisporum]